MTAIGVAATAATRAGVVPKTIVSPPLLFFQDAVLGIFPYGHRFPSQERVR